MKENSLEFYISKTCCLKDGDDFNLDFISPILKRRLNKMDKITISAMNNVYSNKIQNIVFSSEMGQCERLYKIVSQYKENKEVSPSSFSASVHNYTTGFFLLNKQNTIPYTTISSFEGNFEIGLLSAVISNFNNILYCYSDIIDDKYISVAFNISKTKDENSKKYKITLKNSHKRVLIDDYIKLFEGKTNIAQNPLYIIERAD